VSPDGQAQRRPDPLCGGPNVGGEAGVLLGDVVQRGVDHGRNADSHEEAEDKHSGQHSGDPHAVGVDRGEQQQTGCTPDKAGCQYV
jgi:hypothetical protein